MLRRQIQILRQIFFMWIPEVFFRAHPPEGCSFFHSRISDQILMFKCCFHIFRCLKGNAVFTCFLHRLDPVSADGNMRHICFPPSVQYGVIHPSQVQTLHDLPFSQSLNCFCSRSVWRLPEAVAVQINLLYFRKSMSFLLLKASIHYKNEMPHLCCALPSAYLPDTVAEISAISFCKTSFRYPSNAENGSSKRITSGSPIIIRASATRCCCHRKAVPDNDSPAHQADIFSDSHVSFLLFAIFLHDSRREYCL